MQMPPELPAFNPYAAPAARLDDIETKVLHLASRGSRFVANLLDAISAGLVFGLMIVNEPTFAEMQYAEAWRITCWVLALLAAVGLIASNWIMLHRNGQTLGKRLFNIKVVQTDGSRVALWRFIFLRYGPLTLLSAIPGVGGLVSIVDSLMIFGEQQRCLHDHMANTIVITV